MTRTKQQKANRATNKQAPRRAASAYHNREHDPEFMAAQEQADRRERILADQYRVAAKWRPKIPQIRKVNFENFKNRFQGVDEPDHVVDVLVGPDIGGQIRREQADRRHEELALLRQGQVNPMRERGATPGDNGKTAYPEFRPEEKQPTAKDKKREPMQQQQSSPDAEIHRIRIQSQPVLGHLTSLLNHTIGRSMPRTFMKPFKTLVYFQPKMKEILATLEEKWADVEELHGQEDEVEEESASEVDVEFVDDGEAEDMYNGKSEDSSNEEEDEEDDAGDDAESIYTVDSTADGDFDGLMDSPEALRDMRCYVNFIDKDIMPLYSRFDGSDATMVSFEDLWSLFRLGDVLYLPAPHETAGRYHEVWRVYSIEAPGPWTRYPPESWEFFEDTLVEDTGSSKFHINAYYIDHDGNSFGAVKHCFKIAPFSGECPIHSLEVYPIRYRHDHQGLLASLRKQGGEFVRFLDDRHQQYSAWTLTRNPPSGKFEEADDILDNEDCEKMRHPQFVESDVVVDMTEAYQMMPSWRPSFHYPITARWVRRETCLDEMPIQYWSDASRHSLAYRNLEIIQKVDGVEMRQRYENLTGADTFLKSRTYGPRALEANPPEKAALELRDEDLVLLPKRMFAYALRERRFIPVDLNLLRSVRREPGVFENLRIQPEYKDIVRGLVMSHFRNKDLERRYADALTEGPGQDLIQGKGRGLVVLLHGVPGVGKTATAEAVAMENRKPLFLVTCGDLGLTPQEVESSLMRVFRLAHLWDCVLLLDEADVFLSQRSKLDMKRNALVSVFLRVLEYYNGLLFLTTNRVGVIDEAFKSRIHLSLYYPPLDKTKTRDIFRLNISKLKEMEAERHGMTGEPTLVVKERDIMDFATRHYDELARSTGCWNGRQIRSAFQIASSLAHHSHALQTEAALATGRLPPPAPVVDSALFEKVQLSTQSFDRHMKKEAMAYEAQTPLRGSFAPGME